MFSDRGKKSRLGPIILAALACYSASGITALTMIVLNRNYGIADLGSFLYWSLPLALVVGGASLLPLRSSFKFAPITGCLWSAALGAVIGALWSLVVVAALGPWFRAFSFPVVHCWIAGGAIGMISATRSPAKDSMQLHAIKLSLVVLTLVGAVTVAKSHSVGLVQSQRLEIVWAKRLPGPNVLVSDDDSKKMLTREELDILGTNGVTGRLIVSGISVHGEGKTSRALIIMENQLKTESDLPQPEGTNIIYVQHGDEWEKLPANAPTLKRKIHLEVSESNQKATQYWVELASGARQGGNAFVWE